MDRIQPKIDLKTETTIRTYMIGTLQKMEEGFGHMWGHGKPEDSEFTEEEEDFFDLYRELRERILDLGNQFIDLKRQINALGEREDENIEYVNRRGKIVKRRKIYGP